MNNLRSHCRAGLLCLLAWLLLLPMPARATAVRFTLGDWTGSATAGRKILVRMINSPTPTGAAITVSDRRMLTTGSDGTVTTNLVAGYYLCTIQAPPDKTEFRIRVVDTNITVEASSLMIASYDSVASGAFAWSVSASDARYAFKGETGGTNSVDTNTVAIISTNAAQGVVSTNTTAVLDAVTSSLLTTSNALFVLLTNGTLSTFFGTIMAGGTNSGSIGLVTGSGNHTNYLVAPGIGTNLTIILPTNTPASGQLLAFAHTTNGLQSYWTNASSADAIASSSGSGTNTVLLTPSISDPEISWPAAGGNVFTAASLVEGADETLAFGLYNADNDAITNAITLHGNGDVDISGRLRSVNGSVGSVGQVVVSSGWTDAPMANTPETNDLLWAYDYDTKRTTDTIASGDPRGLMFDADRSSLVGGRFNVGQGTGGMSGTYLPMLAPQYGISWGWSQLARGTTNSSPGDSIKGTAQIGYNSFSGGMFDATFGYRNAALGAACLVAGAKNIAGSSLASTNYVLITSHNTNNNYVTVSGNRTNEFPAGAWVLITQTQGSGDDSACVRSVTNSVYSTETTIYLSGLLAEGYNAKTNSWIVNVTEPNNGYAVAVGQGNRSLGAGSFSAGHSNLVTSSAGAAIGQLNSLAGTANFAAGTSNRVTGAFADCMLLGNGNTAARSSAVAVGLQASSARYGGFSHAAGMFGTQGDAQFHRSIARLSHTHATTAWTNLWLNGTSERFTLVDGAICALEIRIIGTDASLTNVADFSINATARRSGSTIAVLYSNVATNLATIPNTGARLTANSTSASVDVEVASTNSYAMRWVSSIQSTEVRQ